MDARAGSIKCPVAGCNRIVTAASLTEDTDAVVAVEAFKRKLDARRKRKRALEDDDDDDDDDA